MTDSAPKSQDAPAGDSIATPQPRASAQAEIPGLIIPTRFRRIGCRGFRWEVPRTFVGYFADATKQVLGATTKYVIRTKQPQQPEYLIKYAQKHGKRETLTEFFVNRLGLALGLNMAHSGLVSADGIPTFLTRLFTTDKENLRHGSLIIEDCFKREQAVDFRELEGIHRRSEQEFYSIDFVTGVMRLFCGADFDSVFPPFIEMLVFDALIGSMDRHSQNWGVLETTVEPARYKFAPIFDTARALLWSLDETQVQKLSVSDAALARYIDKARPCMGPVRNHPKVNDCNHFDFVANLLELYPDPVTGAVAKLSKDVGFKSARVLNEFPFKRGFTGARKRLILKILTIRSEKLSQILAKGGGAQ